MNNEHLDGMVMRIVYRSEETGYTVAVVRASDGAEVTLVGNCGAIWDGESVRAEGRWDKHPQHGKQFRAESISCVTPATSEGIRRYLSSGMIRGIGEVTAGRIVERFGVDTLEIVEKQSKRLLEIQGIGKQTLGRIKESWEEHAHVRNIMIFLQGYGIGYAQSMRIYRQYKTDAIAIVKANPYRLCRDVWGIGFQSADAIAMKMGIEKQSPLRAGAGVHHVLETCAEEGHCFTARDKLLEFATELLEMDVRILTEALATEVGAGRIVDDSGNLYLKTLYTAETSVAYHFERLLNQGSDFRTLNADKALKFVQSRSGIEYAPRQIEALRTALSEKVSIITGGPGVGKTTVVKGVLSAFKKAGLVTMLSAPTGRAAKRMEEASGAKATTIHRMLKFIPPKRRFEHDENNPLKLDVLILDEVSMIDVSLMMMLLKALPAKARLVLVGDTDQLPSVGPGNVLRDLIQSGVIPSVELDVIFRQGAQSWIVHNAHLVNRGKEFDLGDAEELRDFYFIEKDDPDDVLDAVASLVCDRIPARFGLDPREGIQVLSPMRRSSLGVDNLNELLQAKINPNGPSVQRVGRTYRVRDRVMQLRNNYDKDVYNGDIGFIRQIDDEAQKLTVLFDGRPIVYEFRELEELTLAYASSIHKSQGSEYPAVVVLLATQHYKLLQRNLLYTAITRGVKLVCVVGSKSAVKMALANNSMEKRRTGLAMKVREASKSSTT